MSVAQTQHRPHARQSGLGVLIAGGCLLLGAAAARADVGSDIATAFKEGQVNVSFRYRYELVDDDAFSQKANASTLRSRIAYKTAEYEHLSGLLELSDVHSVGNEDYNSTRNGKTNKPVVADPEGTDLIVGALQYTGIENTSIIAGRQKINLDNERFVGVVPWRQHEQTYDSVSVTNLFGGKLQTFYAYVNEVRRIYGPEEGTPPSQLNGNTHLANISYTFGPIAKATVYGYFLDLDEPAPVTPAASLSSQTIGARVAGDFAINDQLGIPYVAEFARQQDYAGNPNNYDANYMLAELGVRVEKLTVKLGYEVLDGSTTPGEAFQTPLATLHAFQGWADKFTTTPVGGIEDAYVAIDYTVFGTNLKAIYHGFQAETDFTLGGSRVSDYGDEIDLSVTYPFLKNYAVSAKYADYSADSDVSSDPRYEDTRKFWLVLTANF